MIETITKEWLEEQGAISRKDNEPMMRKKLSAKWKAKRLHKIRQECCIKGCTELGERHHSDYNNPSFIIWLCRKHHNIFHGKVKKTCSVCEKEHHAKGFCRLHYRLKYGISLLKEAHNGR